MKILIYGIGVLGSTLLHELCQAGHDVTGIARSQYDNFIRDGVVIRHYFQRKTTVDRPTILKTADPDTHYDVVFSVMQATQQDGVLDALSRVNTSCVVLIGNNPEAERMEKYIQEHSTTPRSIIFGFQNSGGHREDHTFVVGRLPITLLQFGHLHGACDERERTLLNNVFKKTSCRISWLDDMYGYYLCHIAEIMPIACLCYKLNYDLKLATGKDIRKIVQASHEAFEYLKNRGGEDYAPRGSRILCWRNQGNADVCSVSYYL